ncbi:hypothetical protein DPEC_G00192500 [Dallia pectoralis]|uniref:Uncharacterized protein n=1 Tax=Dallia pectoralis TaxID=75939 RepID=A0ACC2GC86_DALPE|nr:hypothetical protein DPEC_G00192500 [Dallia pectoralis]
MDDAANIHASIVTVTDPLTTWTTVGAKDGRRGSLPLFSPVDEVSLLTLSNYYAPLETLQGAGMEVEHEAMSSPLHSMEKQPAVPNPTRPVKTSIYKSRKRPISTMPTDRCEKRRRCFSTSEIGSDIGCVPLVTSPATDGFSVLSDDVIHLAPLSRLATTAGAEPATPPSSRELQSHTTYLIHQNLSSYMYNDTSLPQVLLLSDSFIKGIKLSACITYCLSNEQLPYDQKENYK